MNLSGFRNERNNYCYHLYGQMTGEGAGHFTLSSRGVNLNVFQSIQCFPFRSLC